MRSIRDLAWAAGLFEGEGSISTNGRNYSEWRLQVKMTDEDVLRRFHEIVGCGTFRGPFVPNAANHGVKPYWRWQAGAQKDVLQILYTFYPLLGTRRQARALEAIRSLVFKPRCEHDFRPRTPMSRCGFCREEARHAG